LTCEITQTIAAAETRINDSFVNYTGAGIVLPIFIVLLIVTLFLLPGEKENSNCFNTATDKIFACADLYQYGSNTRLGHISLQQ
jgi:hypothetical protein